MTKNKYNIRIDHSRDELLTDFGKQTLLSRYCQEGESFQEIFARVASRYADHEDHAQRLYDYMSQHWFMPATPILANGGTSRGLPISCYTNEVEDSLSSIFQTWNENGWLASRGGGIGTYWGNVRSIGEKIDKKGETSGVIPFIRVTDSMTLAVSQGSLRRGSTAVYMPINHPEIESFMEMRKPTGGDPNRKALNIHHGVLVSDAFMQAVEEGNDWNLVSPHTGEIIKTVSARSLWVKLLTIRIEQGEPYIIFTDTVNRNRPSTYKKLGLDVKTSNLCAEIMLTTGKDHLGFTRTGVCCLSSLNLDRWEEWEGSSLFIEDIMRFIDNVLEDFIENAPDSIESAVYSALRERSVGIGAMGFHHFLQRKGIPFESVMASVWNKKMFSHIRAEADESSRRLAHLKGACLDALEIGLAERFTHKTAIAPTASISIIAGEVSPGIDPVSTNIYLQKTLTGSYTIKNKYLKELLASIGKDSDEVWQSIIMNGGSVQHLDFLTSDQKDVFKTAFEIDQRWVIEHAADRTPFICQSQPVNLFLRSDVHKRDLNAVHMAAWKKGLKSLYYCRSISGIRAEGVAADNVPPVTTIDNKYEECLSCQ